MNDIAFSLAFIPMAFSGCRGQIENAFYHKIRCKAVYGNKAFSCSLRMGEMLGLTWDCIDISEKSIKNDCACIFVNKELFGKKYMDFNLVFASSCGRPIEGRSSIGHWQNSLKIMICRQSSFTVFVIQALLIS